MQTFTGTQYLEIDIASNFGLDKKTWNERLTWFDENKHQLHSLVQKAETPALFYAGVKAWEAVSRGEPIGYPVSLDATSSGLQLLAVLTGDRQAAELCNVVNMPLDFSPEAEAERRDGYTIIYQAMSSRLGEGSKIKRDEVKQAIMTALYGSKAVPKKVFGEGEQLAIFYDVMNLLAPGAWELNETFIAIWDKEALSNDWVLPDNFHVHIKVMSPTIETIQVFNEPVEITRHINAPMAKGRSLGANTVHSLDGFIVREMTRRCDYDPKWISLVQQMLNDEVKFQFTSSSQKHEARVMVQKLWDHYRKSGYLSVRILDYIDYETILMVDHDIIQEMIDSLPAKPFKVICTHDCFRALPHYMNDVRKQYNLQLYMIANSDLLSYIFSQLLHRDVKLGKLDETLSQDILESDYSLS